MPGVTKYGPEGMYSEESFAHLDLPNDLKQAMVKTANHSLAKKTWQSYRTANKHLEACQQETGAVFNLPLQEKDVLLFTSWLIARRGVRAATADCYLSAIRQAHMARGVNPPNMRSELVKSVLKGGRNVNTIEDRTEGRPSRLPVTISMMKLIKAELGNSNHSYMNKRLLWLVCSLNFYGCFRVHETLARVEGKFDPAFTLLAEDVELKEVNIDGKKETLIQLKLKSPKEDRVGRMTYVDVYETGGILCPVRAYKKWKDTNPPCEDGLPAFRLDSGVPLTGRKLNAEMKKCLKNHIPYELGTVTSHSFRSGMASLMGELGYSDTEIQAMGRWSSSAFESYIKLPRRKRSEMARDIGRRGW